MRLRLSFIFYININMFIISFLGHKNFNNINIILKYFIFYIRFLNIYIYNIIKIIIIFLLFLRIHLKSISI